MDFLGGLVLQAGVSLNSPAGDSDVVDFREIESYHLKLHKDEMPAYLWASNTEQENFVLGQGISTIDANAFGFGLKHKVSPKVTVFGEIGYSLNNETNDVVIQQEVIYTYLVDRHNVFNRPVPVEVNRPYDQESYETTYTIENSFMAKIGVEYSVTDWFSVGAAYRFNRMEAKFELYDQERRDAGQGYWEERQTLDAGAFEVQFLVNF